MIKLIKEFNQLDNSQQIYFLSLIEESFLLLEGIKSAKEKYLDEIGEDKFNELIEIDPSKNKKYLDWICKEYLNGVDIERLKNGIKLFDEKCNKNLIKNKDIYFYNNIDELENILNETPDISNRKKKEEIKKNPNKEEIKILPDIDVLRNDDEYFIAEIHSWEDAKFYGKGTKWCISERDNNKYWKEHYEDDKDKFIYVRDFKYPDLGMNSDVNYKLMIQIPCGVIYNKDNIHCFDFKCSIWDAEDRKHSANILRISERFKLNLEDISNLEILDFNTKSGIKKWLDFVNIKNYTINDDLTVDIDGDVFLGSKDLQSIPIHFGKVIGDFYCSRNNLKSLEGSPKIVEGKFDCSFNPNLESLEGSPKIVEGNFDCSYNPKLESLKGAPNKTKGFYCYRNSNLKSLEGSPEIVKENFDCSYNPNLKSLKGAPKEVKDFYCNNNPNLKSLEGAPKIVNGDFYCENNPKLSKEYLDNFNFSFVKGKVIK